MAKRNFYDWPGMVPRLRIVPGQWVCVKRSVPVRILATVRLKRHPALRIDDGTIEGQLLNRYKTFDGRELGDIYCRFVPKGREEDGQ